MRSAQWGHVRVELRPLTSLHFNLALDTELTRPEFFTAASLELA